MSLTLDLEVVAKKLTRKAKKEKMLICTLMMMNIRVSQKIQKSEFWNATYPSGFHRLDEPPEKISAL